MRIAFYGLLALIVAGLALCGTLVVASLSSEPGANMVLMGFPLVAAPVACLGAALAWLAASAGDRLRLAERRIAYIVGAATVLPFAVIVALG